LIFALWSRIDLANGTAAGMPAQRLKFADVPHE
jgi:hypothetical protein